MNGRKEAQATGAKRNTRDRPPTAAEARAEFEANRERNRAVREAALGEAFSGGVPGGWIVLLAWASTAVFGVITVLAVVAPDTFIVPYFAASVGLFLAGSSLFVVDIFLAAGRSRDDLMGIGGLFLLVGCAPRSVQLNLWSALALQIVVAGFGAAIHPFTPLAFGTLVPVAGLSLCGLWAVLHGHFPPQKQQQAATDGVRDGDQKTGPRPSDEKRRSGRAM